MILLGTIATALAAPYAEVMLTVDTALPSERKDVSQEGVVAPGLAAALRVAPTFGIELRGALNLIGIGTVTTVSHGGFDSGAELRPTVRETARFQALAVFTPLQGDLAGLPLTVDAGVGLAILATLDVPVGADPDDPVATSTMRQWRPGLAWTVGPRLEVHPGIGVSARLGGVRYIEVIESTELTTLHRVGLGLATHISLR